MTEQFVIVGAGLAGAKAAETLRAEGFAGDIVLVGAESYRPYERPPLSKGVLIGSAEVDSAYVHPENWYERNRVDLRTADRVVGLDRARHQVELASGETLRYDKLLLATGSSTIELRVPGAHLDGVLYLRTIDDNRRIAEALTPDARVVIIGAGWIGLEVAAAAHARGAHVTMVDPAVLPLMRVLGTEVASIFADLHRAKGATLLLATSVRRIDGDGRVSSVTLEDGSTLPADVVIVGIGIRPNVDIAAHAGITVDNGVMTDASLRTSDPDVFACGDVANSENPLLGRHVRVEHWANALNGGTAAAKAMLGQDVVYDRVPYFFSDQYDLGMEYAGYVEPGGYDSVVFRGDTSIVDGKAPEFVAFWVKDGRVLAGMNVNVWDVQDDIQKLVRAGYAGGTVDLARLADPGVALADLVPAG